MKVAFILSQPDKQFRRIDFPLEVSSTNVQCATQTEPQIFPNFHNNEEYPMVTNWDAKTRWYFPRELQTQKPASLSQPNCTIFESVIWTIYKCNSVQKMTRHKFNIRRKCIWHLSAVVVSAAVSCHPHLPFHEMTHQGALRIFSKMETCHNIIK